MKNHQIKLGLTYLLRGRNQFKNAKTCDKKVKYRQNSSDDLSFFLDFLVFFLVF